MNKKSINSNIINHNSKDKFSFNKENPGIPEFLGTNQSFIKKRKATVVSNKKPLSKRYPSCTQPLHELKQPNSSKWVIKSSSSNVSNSIQPSSNCPHSTSIQNIEACISLCQKYIDEKNYRLAWKEAKKGLNLPGCNDFQKLDLTLYLSSSCTKLKDCEETQKAIESAIILSKCNNADKSILYNNLSFLLWKKLKDYKGSQEVIQTALTLSSNNNLKIKLLYNLSLACKGLKDYNGEKEALQSALNLVKCNDIQRFRFLFSLSIVYNALEEFDCARDVLESALNLNNCHSTEKIKILTYLSKVWNELKDYSGAEQALQSAHNLHLSLSNNNFYHEQNVANDKLAFSRSTNDTGLSTIDSHIQLAYTYSARKDYVSAQREILAVIGLPECSNDQKIVLFGILADASHRLMNYHGARKASLTALALPECNNAQKIAFGYILAAASHELKYYAEEKQALQYILAISLPLLECSNEVKIHLLVKLYLLCHFLKDEEGALKAKKIGSNFLERDFINNSFC